MTPRLEAALVARDEARAWLAVRIERWQDDTLSTADLLEAVLNMRDAEDDAHRAGDEAADESGPHLRLVGS